MTAQVMPATAEDFILSMNYDPTGLEWVMIFDNACLGWIVDDAGAAPVAPVILGTLPPDPGDTAPIVSPQWAHISGGGVLVPDVWRGQGDAFLDWLATNNGADRKIGATLTTQAFRGAFESWSYRNPGRVYS